MIQIRNLVKTYDSVVALDRIDLDIKSGEILGLLGPNGAGKTTLMKVITGILPYNWGEILIDGMSVLDLSKSKKIKQMIGYLPEVCPVYLDMKVEDFLVFFAKLRGVPKSELNDRIDIVLNAVNLSHKRHKFIFSLSKGYRQRVGIAQALIHNPRILILDEPTVALDPNQIYEIRDLIQNLKKDRTIILSTHILSEVSQICDKIVIIADGRIKIQGSEEEIVKSFSQNKIMVKLAFEETHFNLINILENIESVNNIKTTKNVIEIDYFTENDPSYEIAKALIKNDIKFIEIKKEGSTLEKAFIQLTQK